MKITAFYYLQYPDSLPVDPSVAASEVYVEIASDDGDIAHFDQTYSLTVCTMDYIRQYLNSHCSFAGRSVVVVKRFDDDTIRAALESVLPQIETIGLKKE